MGFLNKIKYPLLISVFFYIIFFYPLLKQSTVIYSGKDSTSYHYQSRIYLYGKLKSGEFPVWSERVNMGYPIYADMERGYLNPVNLVLVKILGPFTSYKLLHFLTYIAGSLGLYLFLKKYKISLLGFAVSNFIYYFSFFHIYHQQHFNLILTTYLLPLALYLVSNRKLLSAILLSLLVSFCFYLGSFQTLLILLIPLALYSFVYRKTLKDLIVTSIISLILITPGLVSTAALFFNSVRSESLVFLEGSFSPVMLSTLVFPFVFNHGDSFRGAIISREYFMHEIYIYAGVTSLVFSVLGYFCIKDVKLKRFLVLCIWFFAIFGFIKYIPLLRSINLVPFSFFRYWVRSSVLVVFVLSVLAGLFITNYKKDLKADFKILVPFGIYFFLLELLNFGKTDTVSFLRLLVRGDYVFGLPYLIWGLVVIGLVVLFRFRSKLGAKKFIYLAATLLFVDILVFSKIAFNNGFRQIQNFYLDPGIGQQVQNGRVLDLSGNLTGDNSLVNDYWNPLGYTVLVPEKNARIIRSMGLVSYRYPKLVKEVNPYCTCFSDDLYKYGISIVVFPDGTQGNIGGSIIGGVEDLTVKEGKVYGKLFSDIPSTVRTTIIYYPGWKLSVNGQQREIDVDEDGFINFYVDQGTSSFMLIYEPVHFYLGLKISAVLGLISLIFVRVLKFRYE